MRCIQSSVNGHFNILSPEQHTGFTPPLRAGAGFTLIEIAVSISILGIFATLILSCIVTSFDALFLSSEQQTLCLKAHNALERMSREIRDAQKIDSPGVGQTGNQIDFKKEHPLSDGEKDVTFSLEQNKIIRTGGLGASRVLVDNVSFFQVQNKSSSPVNSREASLELELTSGSGKSVRLKTVVFPLNLSKTNYKNFYSNPPRKEGDWEQVVTE